MESVNWILINLVQLKKKRLNQMVCSLTHFSLWEDSSNILLLHSIDWIIACMSKATWGWVKIDRTFNCTWTTTSYLGEKLVKSSGFLNYCQRRLFIIAWSVFNLKNAFTLSTRFFCHSLVSVSIVVWCLECSKICFQKAFESSQPSRHCLFIWMPFTHKCQWLDTGALPVTPVC